MILGFAISSSAKISCGGRKTTKQKKLPSRKLAYPTKQESRKNHPASKVWADWDIGYVILPSRVTSIDPKTRSSESPASPSSPQFPPPKNLVATQQRGKGASTQRLPLERLFRSFLSSTRFSGRSGRWIISPQLLWENFWEISGTSFLIPPKIDVFCFLF